MGISGSDFVIQPVRCWVEDSKTRNKHIVVKNGLVVVVVICIMLLIFYCNLKHIVFKKIFLKLLLYSLSAVYTVNTFNYYQ